MYNLWEKQTPVQNQKTDKQQFFIKQRRARSYHIKKNNEWKTNWKCNFILNEFLLFFTSFIRFPRAVFWRMDVEIDCTVLQATTCSQLSNGEHQTLCVSFRQLFLANTLQSRHREIWKSKIKIDVTAGAKGVPATRICSKELRWSPFYPLCPAER